MQLKLTIVAVFIFSILFSCKNSESANGGAVFCDTACMKDSLKFIKEASKLQPFILIHASNCKADSLKWGRIGYRRSIAFDYKLNKDYTKVFYNDTAYVWLMFNTCEAGHGYLFKLPFSSDAKMFITMRAINNLDKKFAVADGIAAWTDRGNLFMENMATQKQAMMTFGQAIMDMDFDAIHETIDSVNITPTHAWAKVKIGDKWEVREKNLEFK